MDDAVHLLVLHQLIKSVEVADVHLYKLVVGFVLDVLQVGKVTRIRQLIQVDDVIVGILVDEETHHMASNEACATSNNNCLHIIVILMFS